MLSAHALSVKPAAHTSSIRTATDRRPARARTVQIPNGTNKSTLTITSRRLMNWPCSSSGFITNCASFRSASPGTMTKGNGNIVTTRINADHAAASLTGCPRRADTSPLEARTCVARRRGRCLAPDRDAMHCTTMRRSSNAPGVWPPAANPRALGSRAAALRRTRRRRRPSCPAGAA